MKIEVYSGEVLSYFVYQVNRTKAKLISASEIEMQWHEELRQEWAGLRGRSNIRRVAGWSARICSVAMEIPVLIRSSWIDGDLFAISLVV